MIKMEPYVKEWYDHFENGKIMGLRCKRCGGYEFPPVTVCSNCSGMDLEWAEMSGEGKLINFSINRFPDKTFASFAPFYYGIVQLTEGPVYGTVLFGVNEQNEQEIFDKLPVDVVGEVQPREGFKFIAFRVKA